MEENQDDRRNMWPGSRRHDDIIARVLMVLDDIKGKDDVEENQDDINSKGRHPKTWPSLLPLPKCALAIRIYGDRCRLDVFPGAPQFAVAGPTKSYGSVGGSMSATTRSGLGIVLRGKTRLYGA